MNALFSLHDACQCFVSHLARPHAVPDVPQLLDVRAQDLVRVVDGGRVEGHGVHVLAAAAPPLLPALVVVVVQLGLDLAALERDLLAVHLRRAVQGGAARQNRGAV